MSLYPKPTPTNRRHLPKIWRDSNYNFITRPAERIRTRLPIAGMEKSHTHYLGPMAIDHPFFSQHIKSRIMYRKDERSGNVSLICMQKARSRLSHHRAFQFNRFAFLPRLTFFIFHHNDVLRKKPGTILCTYNVYVRARHLFQSGHNARPN